MAKHISRPSLKPLLYWGIALVAWFLFPTSWKILTKSSFEEFNAPIWEASTRIRDLSNYWGHVSDSKNTLIKKGRDYQRILADAENQINREDFLQEKLNRLKTLKNEIYNLERELEINPIDRFYPQLTNISLRNLSGWNQFFLVNKGSNAGIQKGQGVISSFGIVGRVDQVNVRFSKIQLITNHNFRIVAHLKGDNRPVIVTGSGIHPGGYGTALLSDIPLDIIIPDGKTMEVVSSNLGGRYPKGLHIGFIKHLQPSTDGLFKTAEINLHEGINKLGEVTILKK